MEEFPKEIQNVTLTAEAHLREIFGAEEGLEAFSVYCDILQLVRMYISYDSERSQLIKLLPEVLRALGNGFEILNDWIEKNNENK